MFYLLALLERAGRAGRDERGSGAGGVRTWLLDFQAAVGAVEKNAVLVEDIAAE